MIWFNGNFTDEENYLSVMDKSNLGMSVFTSALAKTNEIFHWQNHLGRLRRHANELCLSCPYTDQEITDAAKALLQQYNFEYSALRIQISAGQGARGIDYPASPTIWMTCTETADPENAPPVSIKIETEYRRNETDPLSRIKSGNYGANALYKRKAKDQGFDDVIFLNTKGNVTCASTSNIIMEKDGVLFTPPLEDGVMDGTTRAVLISQLGITEKSLTAEELLSADHLWLCNAFGIRCVLSIDFNEKCTKILPV